MTSATIRSLIGTTCRVRYGKKTIDLTLKAGEMLKLDADLKQQAGD